MKNSIIAFGLTILVMIIGAIAEIIVDAILGYSPFDDMQYAVSLSGMAIYFSISNYIDYEFKRH